MKRTRQDAAPGIRGLHDSGRAPTVQARLAAALTLHRAGRLAEAEAAYIAILAQQPRHAHALQHDSAAKHNDLAV
jgi:hypothetical protein